MVYKRRKRIVLGKVGLDAHDNGLRIVSKWLMDSGYEVIYAGLYNTPERIVQVAIEENADAIGISFLGGEHLFYTDKLAKLLKGKDMGDVKLIIGGVIPPDDVDKLKELGASSVFTPGTMRDTIISIIDGILKG
ncbi:MAG: methylmalonyl-CoA mutase [Deltaproteobacteria bacterium]|nr:MAG: methylmalonyl-CoA mutase [Deltaproteobacteria bacterium]